MFKLDLEKAEEPEVKLQTTTGKTKGIQKNINICFSDNAKTLTTWITTKWKILKEMQISDHLTCHLRNLYAGQEVIELNMEKWTGSKLGKQHIKAVNCRLLIQLICSVNHVKRWAR